jgi:hypothetical protein
MIVDKIFWYLNHSEKTLDKALSYEVGQTAQWDFERQFMSEEIDKTGTIWLSSCGKCPRQLAYSYHGFEKNGKEQDGRAKLTFFAGNIAEIAVTCIGKKACKEAKSGSLVAIGKDQLELYLPIEGTVLRGHPDGLYFENEFYLVECKSMTSWAFDEFEKGIIDESYLSQVNIYMGIANLKKCIFIAYNKLSNVLSERIVDFDQSIYDEAIKTLTSVLKSSKESLPMPKYTLNEDRFYPWNCLYCAYWKLCHPNAELVLVKKAYKLKEKEELCNSTIPTTQEA